MSEEAPKVPIQPEVYYGSVDEILADGVDETEYAVIEGFSPGKKIRIATVTAGDIIEWSEASEGEAKRTAGLRLIVKSLVNDKNVRIASDRDIAKLRTFRHSVTEGIIREILKLNKMTAKGEKIEKND